MEKLRVWYIDRVPSNKSFHYPVKNIEEAKLIIDVLSKRDLNDDRITDNAMGLQRYNEIAKEWEEWENEEGETIDDIEED